MSTYETSHITITRPSAQVEAALEQLLSTDGSWIGSQALERAASAPLSTSDAVESLTRRWESLGRLPGAESVLAHVDGVAFQRSQELTSAAFAARAQGLSRQAQSLARRADSELSASVVSGVEELRQGERRYVGEVVSRSLTHLGYRVSRREGSSTTGLLAERDHHVLGIRVDAGGSLELDVAGLAGGECARPVQELHEELRRQGLECDITRRVEHGDDRGGTLIRAAAQRNPQDLADGIVKAAETAPAPRTPAQVIRGTRLGLGR